MWNSAMMEHYDPSSEITVLAVCLVMLLLLAVSFKVRMKSFRIFVSMLGLLMLATSADLMLHYLLKHAPATPLPILQGLRSVYHVLLYVLLHLYAVYICEATMLEKPDRKPYLRLSVALLAIFSVLDTVMIFTGSGMRFVDGMLSFDGSQVFTVGYVLFVTLLTVMLLKVRNRLYHRVMIGFFGVLGISLMVLITARLRTQSTFTAATFLFPLIAVMYLLHSNPYDAQLGANSLRGMNNLIHYAGEREREFLFLSLYMRELDESGATMSEELRSLIRHVAGSFYHGAALFQVSNGHMLLLVPKRKNPDWVQRTERILKQFDVEYPKFRYDYKMVIGESTPELTRKNEYISFIRSIHVRIAENTIYRVRPDDLEKYRQYDVVLRELVDIAAKKDPEDPRVLVYCQPVYNIQTGRYDTAEALMRLKLDELGLVFPDTFIPMAEENGTIHVLTEIILNKTCRILHELIAEGYEITRISVNVSALELRDQGFCGDIEGIILRNGIDGSRIAIELTESRNDNDFLLMKERIEELKDKGITLYLDDFGTGYSNMERILELPFDIIKFDRSMVISAGQNERSEQVLGSLAELFSRLNYSVLYEGVEDEKDEKMCSGLSASYLQGYKYSRPIPIDGLRSFLTQTNKS